MKDEKPTVSCQKRHEVQYRHVQLSDENLRNAIGEIAHESVPAADPGVKSKPINELYSDTTRNESPTDLPVSYLHPDSAHTIVKNNKMNVPENRPYLMRVSQIKGKSIYTR